MSVIITQPKSVTRTVVRKQHFEAHNTTDVAAVVDRLLSERHTGPLTVYLSQGGVRGISAEDKADLPST